ncbi:hypothetical protein [Alkalibacterium sp. 20]|uniref:hypothetical protein n=1 Tax=Alkalibacterium sp. 20 TaxID=1798803 RepID=UPI000900157C|nr:hypothetical protein [Alkalibacterium sp. 20]OJF96164.1 hypothetical protein AX762_05370 [Alkalibacterium sp. 20]
MKKNVIFSILGIVLLATLTGIGGYFIGNTTAVNTIDSKTYTVASIDEEIDVKRDNINSLDVKIKDNEDELNKISKEHEEVKKLIEEKTSLENEIKSLSTNKESLNKDTETLNTNISDSEKKLKKLEEGIVLKEAEPRTLISGEFVTGKDIDAGRYKVYPTDKFEGELIINDYATAVFFSKDESYGAEEYVLNIKDGDKISASVPLTFAPVE